MKLASTHITAAALAFAPVTAVGAWVLGPRFFGFDRPLVLSPSEILRDQQALIPQNLGIKHSSPRYEITNDNEKFQVAVDVPGVKMEDIHVTLEGDNSLLSVSGVREASGDTYSFTSKFSQSFSLDPSIDSEKFSANLKDGVLIVSAPKDMKRLEQNIRKIPVMEHKDTSPTEGDETAKEQTKEAVSQEVKVEAKDTSVTQP